MGQALLTAAPAEALALWAARSPGSCSASSGWAPAPSRVHTLRRGGGLTRTQRIRRGSVARRDTRDAFDGRAGGYPSQLIGILRRRSRFVKLARWTSTQALP